MNPFVYERASNQSGAIKSVANDESAKFIAGGTNLVDLMKEGVERPARLVDISRLDLTKIEPTPDGALRLGALARNSDTANDPQVRSRFPLLSQAILAGASAQLRNMATNGGNLLQRTRCFYFYDVHLPCNKREPGSGCSALEGFNRIHAIFGASDKCIAVHPSDMCVALAALDTTVRVQGASGERTIPFAEFHRLPGDTPQFDTNLKRGELITAIELPAASTVFADHSHYRKVRDRASYAFALVSVAAALEMNGDAIRQARIVMGGVAHKPWRAFDAEDFLKGKRADEATFRQAAEISMRGAKPYKYNAFKIEMGKRAVARALMTAAKGTGATA